MLDAITPADIQVTTILPQARQVADAEARQQRAARQLEAATAELSTAQARTADLTTERASIVARRARGQVEPDDAGRLALLAADLEALAGIEAEALARVEAARGPYDLASTMVANARRALEHAEHEQAKAALLAYLRQLDTAMQAGIAELAVVQQQLGTAGVPAWGPSRELAQALRKVLAMRNEL